MSEESIELTDEELFMNYYDVLKYHIKINDRIPEDIKIKLGYNPSLDDFIKIEKFDYDIEKPTKEKLKKYQLKGVIKKKLEDIDINQEIKNEMDSSFSLYLLHQMLNTPVNKRRNVNKFIRKNYIKWKFNYDEE